jgi:preprotein translocase subunit SecG
MRILDRRSQRRPNPKSKIQNPKSKIEIFMSFLLYLFFILFIVICVFLILLVLIQKGRGGGISSAFGGGGGNTAFGSKTGDVLTWATSVVFGVFLILAIGLNLVANAYDARARGVAAPTPGNPPAQQGPGGPTGPANGGETSLPQVPVGAPEPAAQNKPTPTTNP